MIDEVRVTFVGHATVLVAMDGLRILTDPFLRRGLGPLARHGPLPDPAALGPIDLVVLSHAHPDHFDPRSLAMLQGEPVLVVPRGLARLARAGSWERVVELTDGRSTTVGPLEVHAVAARHWTTPGGPAVDPVGYVLDGSSSVYFAGDTGRFPRLRELAGRVDLALLPIWTWGPHLGPGHLGPRSAAEVLVDIAPVHAAVPIHWATLYPRRLHHVWRRPLREPGERFAAHAAKIAPTVDVRVLAPGSATTFTFPRSAPDGRG